MNKNERKLVTALRSGEFTQAKGALRRGDSFCCLGVACELYRRENPQASAEWVQINLFPGSSRDYYFKLDGRTAAAHLTPEVTDWLGWTQPYGALVEAVEPSPSQPRHRRVNLADLNDSGYTFEQIADVIESGGVRKLP